MFDTDYRPDKYLEDLKELFAQTSPKVSPFGLFAEKIDLPSSGWTYIVLRSAIPFTIRFFQSIPFGADHEELKRWSWTSFQGWLRSQEVRKCLLDALASNDPNEVGEEDQEFLWNLAIHTDFIFQTRRSLLEFVALAFRRPTSFLRYFLYRRAGTSEPGYPSRDKEIQLIPPGASGVAPHLASKSEADISSFLDQRDSCLAEADRKENEYILAVYRLARSASQSTYRVPNLTDDLISAVRCMVYWAGSVERPAQESYHPIHAGDNEDRPEGSEFHLIFRGAISPWELWPLCSLLVARTLSHYYRHSEALAVANWSLKVRGIGDRDLFVGWFDELEEIARSSYPMADPMLVGRVRSHLDLCRRLKACDAASLFSSLPEWELVALEKAQSQCDRLAVRGFRLAISLVGPDYMGEFWVNDGVYEWADLLPADSIPPDESLGIVLAQMPFECIFDLVALHLESAEHSSVVPASRELHARRSKELADHVFEQVGAGGEVRVRDLLLSRRLSGDWSSLVDRCPPEFSPLSGGRSLKDLFLDEWLSLLGTLELRPLKSDFFTDVVSRDLFTPCPLIRKSAALLAQVWRGTEYGDFIRAIQCQNEFRDTPIDLSFFPLTPAEARKHEDQLSLDACGLVRLFAYPILSGKRSRQRLPFWGYGVYCIARSMQEDWVLEGSQALLSMLIRYHRRGEDVSHLPDPGIIRNQIEVLKKVANQKEARRIAELLEEYPTALRKLLESYLEWMPEKASPFRFHFTPPTSRKKVKSKDIQLRDLKLTVYIKDHEDVDHLPSDPRPMILEISSLAGDEDDSRRAWFPAPKNRGPKQIEMDWFQIVWRLLIQATARTARDADGFIVSPEAAIVPAREMFDLLEDTAVTSTKNTLARKEKGGKVTDLSAAWTVIRRRTRSIKKKEQASELLQEGAPHPVLKAFTEGPRGKRPASQNEILRTGFTLNYRQIVIKKWSHLPPETS